MTDVGLKVQAVFAGQPVTENATGLVKPLIGVTEIVVLPTSVGLSVNEVGLADIEKSAVAGAPQPLNLKDPMRVYQP